MFLSSKMSKFVYLSFHFKFLLKIGFLDQKYIFHNEFRIKKNFVNWLVKIFVKFFLHFSKMAEQQIIDITGLPRDQARQYLEMANGDVQRAIDLYFSGAEVRKPTRPAQPRPAGSGPMRGQPAPRPAQPQRSANDIVKDIFDNASNRQQPEDDEETAKNVSKHKIVFYKNGFVVDDGEFRDNNDPANAEFLASVEKGQVPRELMNRYQAVDIEVEDNREETYKKPKAPVNPFAGQSRTLGDAVPQQKPQPAPTGAVPANQTKSFADAGQPTTKLRIKFNDSSMLTLTVNQSATIGDVKKYISQCRPEYRPSSIKLKVNMPPKELNNDSATILDEGLKMAQINVL